MTAASPLEPGVAGAADETLFAHVDQPMVHVAMPPLHAHAAQSPDRLLSRTAPTAGIQFYPGWYGDRRGSSVKTAIIFLFLDAGFVTAGRWQRH